jgi:hypothetical protein
MSFSVNELPVVDHNCRLSAMRSYLYRRTPKWRTPSPPAVKKIRCKFWHHDKSGQRAGGGEQHVHLRLSGVPAERSKGRKRGIP